MKQKQHIIPQVYLKQFGYIDKGGIWKVPIFNIEEIPQMNKIDKTIIRQSNIKSLLQEENIYDIPINNDVKKELENFLKLTEDNYPSVIKEIENNNLSIEKRYMLLGFISLLFVRTKDYRKILNEIIQYKDYSYLNGVFENNNNRIEMVLSLPRDTGINLLIAFSGRYIHKCIQNFKVSIIKAIPEEKWATTDNPVLCNVEVDEKQRRIDFMGINTKLFCPLSPNFLAYIVHKNTVIHDSGLENLDENRVNEIDKETFERILNQLTDKSRITQYLIAPTERK